MTKTKWTAVSIPEEVMKKAKEYYENHEEELRIKHGVRSLSAFITFCLREHFKELGLI